MPYKIRKLPSGLYRVRSANTGEIKSKATTLDKAKKQIKLLYALNNPGFIQRKR